MVKTIEGTFTVSGDVKLHTKTWIVWLAAAPQPLRPQTRADAPDRMSDDCC
jgi:hypothetical protein